MAIRYSGVLTIRVLWNDRTSVYDVTVSAPGLDPRHIGVGRPPSSRLAVDSPKAHDAVAKAAIAFAEDEEKGWAELAESGPDGFVVRRSPDGEAHEAARKRTGTPVRYKHDLYEVLAWDGDFRTRDLLYRASGPKATGLFWTEPEARAWADTWMASYPPAGAGSVRLSFQRRDGYSRTLARWSPSATGSNSWESVAAEGAREEGELHAADFDSLQAALRHEQSAGAQRVIVRGDRYTVLRHTERGYVGHELFFEHGKYHVKKESSPVSRGAMLDATPIEEFLRSGAGLVYMASEERRSKVAQGASLEDKIALADHLKAEKHSLNYIRAIIGDEAYGKWRTERDVAPEEQPRAGEIAPVLYEGKSSAPRNDEGLTFDEWYRAANAFGQRINHERARAEWKANVDPAEWAAREKAGKAPPLKWHRTAKGGVYAGVYEIQPAQGPRGGEGWWKIFKDKVEIGLHPKLGDAKAAAQKDFDATPLAPFPAGPDLPTAGPPTAGPPAPPAARPPQVRRPQVPLEWHRTEQGGLYAEQLANAELRVRYDISPAKGPRGGDGWWQLVRNTATDERSLAPGKRRSSGDEKDLGLHSLLSDAKAAAQKDFNKQRKEAIPVPEPVRVPPEPEIEVVVPEPAPAPPAPAPGGCVPFVKVTRDVANYEACLAIAQALGPIKDAETVYKLLHDALAKEDQEVFLVVLIDVREQLRGVVEVHRGARSMVAVSLQDVLRPVIASGAEAFIVVHPHPSGKADPSESDLHLTKQIAKACKPFGKSMTFVDHVIIGMNEFYSFRAAEPSIFEKRGEG